MLDSLEIDHTQQVQGGKTVTEKNGLALACLFCKETG